MSEMINKKSETKRGRPWPSDHKKKVHITSRIDPDLETWIRSQPGALSGNLEEAIRLLKEKREEEE